MSVSKNLAKKLLLALVFVMISVAFIPAAHIYAGGPLVYYCDSIQFQGASFDASSGKNLLRLPVDDQANIVSTDIVVNIQVSGNSDFPTNAYQFSYVARSASGGSWNNVPLSLQKVSEGVYRASLTITINSAQDWLYSLEAKGSSGVYQTNSNGEANGCGPSGGKTNGVVLGVAATDLNKEFRTNCTRVSGLGDINHFDCQRQGDNTYTIAGNFCAPGFNVNLDRCVGASGLTEFEYCLPCTSDTAVEPTRVPYGEKCDVDNNVLCELLPGLSCNPSPLPGESGVSRCYYTGRFRKVGESCFTKANECVISDAGVDGSPVYCGLANANDPVGICTRLYDGISCVAGADTQCSRELSDPKATCFQGYCLPGYASEQENPITNPEPDEPLPDTSKDYGSRNCPYSIACDEATLRANYPEKDFPGLVNSLLAICAGDTSRGIYKYNKNDPKPPGDQYNEFLTCSRCIRGVDANNESTTPGTWTEAFGCIITSPEGIFTALIRISLGVLGGVALLRITYLGIITAQSKDEGKIAEARKGVIATLSGIAIVILAVLILRVIGVNILDIVPPGFF